MANPGRIFVSNDYSVNGDCSVKVTPFTGTYSIVGINYEFEEGKTYLLEACCLNGVSGVTMEIRDSSSPSSVVQSVSIPTNTDFNNFSIEFTATGVEAQIIFRTYNSENSLYVDNIRLTIL